VDGNKRTALATCLAFLSENGLLPGETVAASELNREQTTKRLRALLPRNA
jgi:prophage maintenance system killer protein